MDCNIGDKCAVFAQVNVNCLHAVIGIYNYTSGDGERAIHPSGAEHSAILFNRKADIVLPCQFGIFLYLEAGTVAMCGSHHKACKILLGYAESDNRRAVAGYKVSLTGFDFPCIALAQTLASGLLKNFGSMRDSLERCGAVFYIVKKFFVIVCRHRECPLSIKSISAFDFSISLSDIQYEPFPQIVCCKPYNKCNCACLE